MTFILASRIAEKMLEAVPGTPTIPVPSTFTSATSSMVANPLTAERFKFGGPSTQSSQMEVPRGRGCTAGGNADSNVASSVGTTLPTAWAVTWVALVVAKWAFHVVSALMVAWGTTLARTSGAIIPHSEGTEPTSHSCIAAGHGIICYSIPLSTTWQYGFYITLYNTYYIVCYIIHGIHSPPKLKQETANSLSRLSIAPLPLRVEKKAQHQGPLAHASPLQQASTTMLWRA